MTYSRKTNYIRQNGQLYITPALFKQLQAVAESDQNFTEAIKTVTTTGRGAEIKLVNPIDTGVKGTITTSDGKTKELSLLIDTIVYPIRTASTAPKGAILVAAQGKTAKVYHHGDQNIPSVVDQSQLTKTITRTINVHEPGKSVTTTKQTVTLTQSVSVVDGKDVTYNGDWKVQGDSQWASYDVPSVPGYTASQSSVAQQEVTDATKDQTVNITYTANDGTQTIVYQDEDGSEVGKQVVPGKTDETVKVTPDVPDGYVVKGEVPSEVTIKPDDTPITVTVEHGKSHVTPDKPVDKGDLIPDTKDKHYPEGLTHNDLNKTVTREITITDPTGKKSTTTQTVTFTRGATVDEVTNKVTYDDWSENGKHTFDKVDVPNVPGYTASGEVSSIAVTPETQSSKVDITYTANDGTQTIVYQDEDGSEVGKQVVPGKTDETVKVTPDVPDGYVVKGEIPTEVTIKPDDTPITVTVEHGESHVTPDKPVNKGDLIPSTKDKHYPEGLTHNDLNKTVTREVTITDPTGKKSTTTQTVTFTRGATVDEVTNKVTYDDWSENGKHTFDKVDVPNVPGYTASGEVSSIAVTPETQSSKVDITYTANAQHMMITYVDDTTGKKLHTDKLDGVSDQDTKYTTVDSIKQYTDLHYKLVSDSTNGKDLIFDHDDNADQSYEVHFVHGTHTINQTTSSKQTIHYVYADDLARHGKAADDNVQQLSFKRDGYNDEVTGTDHWNAWIPANSNYSAVDSPVIQGYTPDKAVIEKSTVNPTDKDTEITIVYNGDKQAARVIYVDKTTNATLTSNNLSGKSDKDSGYNTKDTIDKYQSQHYVLTGDETNGKNVIFDHDDKQNQTYYVYFAHGMQNVSRQDTVTSTIDYKFEDGQIAQPTVTQTKQFSEDGVKDLVTGKITWTKAEPQKFNDVTTPTISGYTPDKANVTGNTVNFGDKDVAETVTYHNNAQIAKITYVDDMTKNTLASDSQDGKFDHEITFEHDPAKVINSLEEKGYKLVSNNFKDGTKYKADDKQNEFIVHLTHDKQNVSRQDQVVETIHYVYENGNKSQPDHEQTISFTEDGIKDKVTGKIAWTPAKPQKFDDVATPVISGYTPDKGNVTGSTVRFGDKDVEVTVTYHNNVQTAEITYIDDTAKKTLGSDKQNGKFNQVITFKHDPAEVIKGFEEKGYKLVSNDFNGDKYQADNSKNVFYVHFVHGSHAISEKKSITETITYTMSDDSTAPDKVEKQVEFSRDGYNDEVTKQDHWNKWQPDKQSFDAVPTPDVTGYTPDIKSVEAKTVTSGDKDITVNVTYTPDQQKAKVLFIDDTTKNTLDTHNLTGVTNGHESYSPSEEIDQFVNKHYVLVSSDYPDNSFTYDNDDSKDQVFEIHLKHGTHAISEKKSITETITYTMSDGSTAPNKVEKQVEFSRDGYNDEVTKQDHWNKWQPDKQSFDAVPTPDVTGYTPNTKLVEAKTVTAGDKDINETIIYTPDKQKAKVVFIDDTTKKTLDTHDLTGVTNSHEKYSPSEEIEKFIHDNYVFVSSDYPEKGFTYDNDDNHDQVFEVHLKERPTKSDTPTIPDNTEDNGGSNDTPTDSDKPEKDNGGSDTVDKSSHKTPVKRNSNKKHHDTKKTNKQKNANKKHQGTQKINNQKNAKTAKLNPNKVNVKTNKLTQTKLGKVQEYTNNELPQTGEKHSNLMAMLGLAISSLGMIGTMKSKKRKDN